MVVSALECPSQSADRVCPLQLYWVSEQGSWQKRVRKLTLVQQPSTYQSLVIGLHHHVDGEQRWQDPSLLIAQQCF